jgi:hypothetical protein
LVKNAIFHSVLKQRDEILLVENQMHAVVPAVLVLAETEGLPRLAVSRENVPLDSPFILLVKPANADRLFLDAAHLGHESSTRFY